MTDSVSLVRLVPRLLRSALIAGCLAIATSAAFARGPDCIQRDLVLEERWTAVEDQMRRNLERPECAPEAREMRYGLAYAIEQQAAADPARACEASRLYQVLAGQVERGAFRDTIAARAEDTGMMCMCHRPAALRRAGRVAEAEAAALERLEGEACAPFRAMLHLEAARLIERDADRLPARACEAKAHYDAVASDDETLTSAGRIGARRMAVLCDVTSPCGPEACDTARCRDRVGCARPARSGPSLGLALGATAAALAAGALFWTAFDADADRADARKDHAKAHAAGDISAVEDAADRHREADSRVTLFGLSAWGMALAGAGLGVASALTWGSDAELAAGASPRGVVFRGRF